VRRRHRRDDARQQNRTKLRAPLRCAICLVWSGDALYGARVPDFTLRDATRQDLSTIADTLTLGFESYRRWAPNGWKPPERTAMLLGLLHRFQQDGSWCVIAFDGDAAAGHVTVRPEHDTGVETPGLARLTHLFVRVPYWGSGLADQLHALAVDGMRERGFGSACLWTPVGQKRARAFYERRGWQATGARDPDNELELELLEYVLEL